MAWFGKDSKDHRVPTPCHRLDHQPSESRTGTGCPFITDLFTSDVEFRILSYILHVCLQWNKNISEGKNLQYLHCMFKRSMLKEIRYAVKLNVEQLLPEKH